jgi:hypothetical protein
MEMKDFADHRSRTPRKTSLTLIIVLVAAIIGASLGILIADSDTLLPVLKRDTAVWIARMSRTQTESKRSKIHKTKELNDKKSDSQPTFRVISTGLSSMSAMRYSVQSDSARLAFDLGNLVLVHMEKLSDPDRIYIDLRDDHQEQGTIGRLGEQKAFSIDGDLVTQVRIAERKSDTIRVVLDLKHSCDFTYQIPPGFPARLIVILQPRAVDVAASKF